mmetsp:Transcript_72/g.162  ORF Transcript_72/g.162 Transcript_72/m.162 type:complete len:220 (+) Transcript_72:401-1060(+)
MMRLSKLEMPCHLPNCLYKTWIWFLSSSVLFGLFSMSYLWNMSEVALGSISRKLPAEHSSPTPSTAAALVVAGERVALLEARGSSREPNSTALQPVVSAKYLGKRTLCTLPNICRGMFLNIVSPTKKVFQMLLPSHSAKEVMCRKATSLPGMKAVLPTAAAVAATGTSARAHGVLAALGSSMGPDTSSLAGAGCWAAGSEAVAGEVEVEGLAGASGEAA